MCETPRGKNAQIFGNGNMSFREYNSTIANEISVQQNGNGAKDRDDEIRRTSHSLIDGREYNRF